MYKYHTTSAWNSLCHHGTLTTFQVVAVKHTINSWLDKILMKLKIVEVYIQCKNLMDNLERGGILLLNIKSGQFSCLVSRSSILEQKNIFQVEKNVVAEQHMLANETGRDTNTKSRPNIPIERLK